MDASLRARAEQLAEEIAGQAETVDDLNNLMRLMMKSTIQRMLDTEMDVHLGRRPSMAPTDESTVSNESTSPLVTTEPTMSRKKPNRRNGRSKKTVRSETGKLTIATPRDRDGTFEPQLIGKHQRRVPGFDEKVLALYAKGMTTRDIQEIVRELYGVEVSATLVSEITADLDAEVTAWRYVADKDSKAVVRDLKKIYQAATVAAAEQALGDFAQAWDEKYPTISKTWRAHWPDIITLFDYPPPIRKAIYTTNAIESVNSVIRKFTRNRKIYPNQESALKLVYMAISEASKRWTMPIRNWKSALNHFAIMFEDRMPELTGK